MVFQSRLPSWIILCSVWLFRFAHTGEAQAAKEGKVMRKAKLWAYLLLLHAKSVGWLSGGPACRCELLVSPPLRKKKRKRLYFFFFFFLVEVGGRKEQGIHPGGVRVYVRETGTTAFALRNEVCEAFARDGKAWGWGGSPRPGAPCGRAALSAGSLQPPGEVQAGRLTSPLRGRGLQGLRAEFRGSGRSVGDAAGLGAAGQVPAATHRGPAALRPRGAGHSPWEGASGCSFCTSRPRI